MQQKDERQVERIIARWRAVITCWDTLGQGFDAEDERVRCAAEAKREALAHLVLAHVKSKRGYESIDDWLEWYRPASRVLLHSAVTNLVEELTEGGRRLVDVDIDEAPMRSARCP